MVYFQYFVRHGLASSGYNMLLRVQTTRKKITFQFKNTEKQKNCVRIQEKPLQLNTWRTLLDQGNKNERVVTTNRKKTRSILRR